eukprot:2748150-Rhodomonas_salina.4
MILPPSSSRPSESLFRNCQEQIGLSTAKKWAKGRAGPKRQLLLCLMAMSQLEGPRQFTLHPVGAGRTRGRSREGSDNLGSGNGGRECDHA